MPLCGSSSGCGCAVTSVAADSGEIDGQFPTITVDGNGTHISPWLLELNENWAGAVVDAIEANATEIDTRGIVARVLGPGADQLISATAVTDVTGVSVTWTADPTRLYRCALNINLGKTTTDIVQMYLRNAANGILTLRSEYMTNGYYSAVVLDHFLTGVTGSQTVKASLSTASGSVTTVGTFSRNAVLYVEDMGPA